MAAKSQWYDFYGTFKWIKNITPDDKYDNYTADLYLDEDEWDKFEESGLQISPKTDEDGKFVRFRRPTKKVIKDELVKFGAPETKDTKGTDLAGVRIANGAKGKAVVVVYDTVKGKGHRLEKIILDTYEEYQKADATDVRTMGDGHESNVTELKKKRPF